MTNDRPGSSLDLEFVLKSGETIILKGIDIKVFDAFRKQKTNSNHPSFDKRFIWGEDSGVDQQEIAGWRVISQYEKWSVKTAAMKWLRKKFLIIIQNQKWSPNISIGVVTVPTNYSECQQTKENYLD